MRRYETGDGTREQFADGVIAEFGLPVDRDAFLAEFAWWPRALFDGVDELLSSLAPRYTVASLSNTNELHWERFSREWSLPERFHHNFPSHEVGRLKPDAGYFLHVLDALGVPPERSALRGRQRDQRRRGGEARDRRAPRRRPGGRARRARGARARRALTRAARHGPATAKQRARNGPAAPPPPAPRATQGADTAGRVQRSSRW